MKNYQLFSLLILFNNMLFGQYLKDSRYSNEIIKYQTHDPNFIIADTVSFYQKKGEWQQIINDFWGPGLPFKDKQEIFNHFADKAENDFPCFNEFPLDWDSLRLHYFNQINEFTSKGRFSAIMAYFAWNLNDLHTRAWDDEVVFTPLNPGTPLLVIRYPLGDHFGALLTPLPDSTLLVVKTVENHPLNIIPGDIVLGYEGVPWKEIIFELIDAEITMGATTFSSPGAKLHGLLQDAGNNWHLFSTIDIVKYSTGDTVHLSTSAMLSLSGTDGFFLNEQLPVGNIPMPNYDYTWNSTGGISYGIVEYTNIGYIYVCKHSYEGVNNDFEEAINALYNTDGLIIDFRYNSGGHVDFSLQEGFSILADFTTYTLDKYIRCSSLDLYSLCKQTEIPESSWFIEGDPTTVYNKPIAILVGPHTISMGEITAYRFKFLPNTRFFGKTTSGGFSNYKDISRMGFEMRLPTYTIVEYENPTKLLVRKEFPVDEYVWLEKDDVANGDDTVVKKAIEWINNPVGVENKSKKTLRTEITLSQNYPNPFNPATTIKYTVPYPQTDGVNGEWPAPTLAGAIVKNVTLKIFDVLGREVATLVNEKQKPGSYKVTWNAADQPSGVYFYKLTAGEFSQSKKLALLK